MSTKSRASNPRAFGSNSPLPAELPIAWMDPMSWRLPSGKALAEFALQSGFLAPLLLGGPGSKHKRVVPVRVPLKTIEKRIGDRTDTSDTFRQTR